ncbi:MAG: helix-turn-helix domain-containing protein [Rhodospirillales bacterium]
MAKKPRKKTSRSSKGKSRRAPRDSKGVPDRIIDAALTLAAARGWRRTGLADIAAEAGVTLAELRGAFPSKASILNGLIRRTDTLVLAMGTVEGSSARDRLFGLLMRRFDALQPHRDAVSAIVRDSICDPLVPICHGPRLLCSMASMLEAAGLSSAGPAGMIRTKGLALIYLTALRAWLTDDSADQARTMAVLDRGLRQAEALAKVLFPSAPKKTGQAKKA